MLTVFIWRGLGFLVPLIAAFTLLIERGLIYLFYGSEQSFDKSPWAMPLGFAVSGFITFALGQYLEMRQKQNQELAPDDDYLFEPNDAFMFLRFKYWGFIWLGLALFAYLRLSGIVS